MSRNVQGRGSGNYIDLSIQEKPPKDPNGGKEMDGQDMDIDWDRGLGYGVLGG